MPGGKVIHVSSQSEFEAAYTSDVVVVDFFANWCGPCKAIAPLFEQLASVLEDVTFLKVDSDQHQSLSARFEIKSLPTFKFFRDGVLTRTEMGANQQMLESWVHSSASPSSTS
eukprot:jgi/Bigna1/43063/e_gw1.72.40.1